MDSIYIAPYWIPIIVVLLTTLFAVTGFFFKNIISGITNLTTKITELAKEFAVMTEHISNSDANIIIVTKYHDEIIEHKVALAELNVKINNIYDVNSIINKKDK